MTIKISSKDIKITPDTEKSVEKKLTQRLKKYFFNTVDRKIRKILFFRRIKKL